MENDFDPKEMTKAVSQHDADLLNVRKEIEELKDKKLDDKICKAIKDSTHIQGQISKIVWKTIKEKIVWILATLVALLLWESLKDVISIITNTWTNQ